MARRHVSIWRNFAKITDGLVRNRTPAARLAYIAEMSESTCALARNAKMYQEQSQQCENAVSTVLAGELASHDWRRS
jgi:hypothetical protein